MAEIIPDVPGDYLIQLIVNDGQEDSDPANPTRGYLDRGTGCGIHDEGNAEAAIENAGLMLGNIVDQNHTIPAGHVFDQDLRMQVSR